MVNDISEKQLKYGAWYVSHKILLRQVLMVSLFILNVLVWGYVLFSLFNNFVLKYESYQQWKADLVVDRYTNYQGILDMTVPRPISILTTQILPSADNKIDVIAEVRNPNDKWVGRFQYSFNTNDGQTELRNGFIMPGQIKFLYDLDIDATEVQSISIGEVSWVRENNYDALATERELFSYEDVQFIPAGTIEGLNTNRAVFTINNDSNFNYYRPTFQVLLRRGGQLVGFNLVTARNFLSHTSQNLESRWFESLPPVEQVEIIPEIDYLSDSSYIPI